MPSLYKVKTRYRVSWLKLELVAMKKLKSHNVLVYCAHVHLVIPCWLTSFNLNAKNIMIKIEHAKTKKYQPWHLTKMLGLLQTNATTSEWISNTFHNNLKTVTNCNCVQDAK